MARRVSLKLIGTGGFIGLGTCIGYTYTFKKSQLYPQYTNNINLFHITQWKQALCFSATCDATNDIDTIENGYTNGLQLIAAWNINKNNYNMKYFVCRGSVVDFTGDAIVNAANVRCLGGDGVDGAINAAGGKKLLEYRRKLPIINFDGINKIRCNIGDAVITESGLGAKDCKLKCKYVIHAVGPDYNKSTFGKKGTENCNMLLDRAYRRTMDVANENDVNSIAFCLISAGIYRGLQSLEHVLSIGANAIKSSIGHGAYSRKGKKNKNKKDEYMSVKEVYMVGYTHIEAETLLKVSRKVFGKEDIMFV